MMNYCIWKNEEQDYRIIVQVYNKCDLTNVQAEFAGKGYVIEGLCHIGGDIGFIACEAKMYE